MTDDTTELDLAVVINRNVNYLQRNRISVSILSATEYQAANPHMPVPAEYGFAVQAGPVVNDRITTIGRAANHKDATEILRREEARLGLPNGTLRPRNDGPQF